MFGECVVLLLSIFMNVDGTGVRRRNQIRRDKRNVVDERRRFKDMISGRELRPSEMPPVLKYTPWNNLTVRYVGKSASGTVNYALSDILVWINKQIGLTAGTSYVPLELRIQNIQIWKTGDGQLSLFPCDTFSEDQTLELTRIDSFSQKNMYARVGYEWPAAHQSHVLKADGTDKAKRRVFATISSPASELEIHLKVLWRPGFPPLAVTGTSQDFFPDISSLDDSDTSLDVLIKRISLLEAQLDRSDQSGV